jgi:hypothetical protein
VPIQPQEKLEKYACIPTEHFGIGASFATLNDAMNTAIVSAKVPLTQRSAKEQKYVYFHCFGRGVSTSSISADERQRNRNP